MPTLAELFRDRYLPHAMESKRSWKTDETLIRCHILPSVGRLPLDEVTQEKIGDVLKRMKERGNAGGTCNRVLEAALLGKVVEMHGGVVVLVDACAEIVVDASGQRQAPWEQLGTKQWNDVIGRHSLRNLARKLSRVRSWY